MPSSSWPGNGHPGWAELREAVATALDATRSTDELAEQFADLACLCYSEEEHVNRRQRAAGLLAEKPELTAASVFAAAAAFDIAALDAHLEKHPACANQVAGPRAWPPLMYLGYSRVPEAPPARDAVDAARLLLRHGADARFYVDGSHGWGGWRWTTLTGVIGEGESGRVNQPPHPRARARADSARRVRLLLEHGADASGRDNRYTHRAYVSNAVLSGHGDILDLLVAHGAPRPDLSREDRFRMAVVGGDAGGAKRLLSEHAGLSRQPGLLVQLAQTNRLDAARLLLDLGADPNAMAMNGRGALHEAAWASHHEMLEPLMDRGGRSLGSSSGSGMTARR